MSKAAAERSAVCSEVKNQSDADLGKQQYKGKRAIVAGAGPAGTVVAAFLSKQGFFVDIYEKYADPTKTNLNVKRAIVISLARKTVDILRTLDVEFPDSGNEFLNGFSQYAGLLSLTSRGPEMIPRSRRLAQFRTERHELAKQIMSAVREEEPERITFHFNHACVGADLAEQEVYFQNQDDTKVKQDYDLLIGADGAHSEIRKAMEEQVAGFKIDVTQQSRFYRSYRDIVVKSDTDALFWNLLDIIVVAVSVSDKYKMMLQPGVLTFYRNLPKFGSMEGVQRMSFMRTAKGDLVGNFAATQSGYDSVRGKEKEYLNNAMPDGFPQDWIDQMIPQLRDNPSFRVPAIIEVSTLIGPSVVLVGDAGHYVSPTTGFGCNMAIQDAQYLYDALESAQGVINRGLEIFNDARHKEVKSFQLLEKVASAAWIRQNGRVKLLPILAKTHRYFHVAGHKYMPWLVPSTVFTRLRREEIDVGKAVQILNLELASLLSIVSALKTLW